MELEPGSGEALAKFPEKLNIGCEGVRRSKDVCEAFDLSNLKNRFIIF